MRSELIAACQMFLAPTTVLLAALGLAKAEGLKVGISVVGFGISVVWLLLVLLWPDLKPLEMRTAMALSIISGLVWSVSAVVHAVTTVGWKGRLPTFMQPD